MGSTERRERERQAVRTKILDAARVLFAAEGYDAVTMRRIADAIEYSPTAIYLHFKDKERLILELCREDSMALAKVFHRIAREPDPVERLRAIGLSYVAFGLEHPNHYRLMFMTRHRLEADDLAELGHGNPEKDGYAFLIATLNDAIAGGRLKPGIDDPQLVAQVFWAGVHGIVSLHLAKAGDPWVAWRPVHDTAATLIEALLRGLTEEHRPHHA
jgi:AcrR family transcriptional regulator